MWCDYKSRTPSFVSAANLTPTGNFSRDDISAICSLPFPDAMLRATSVPLIFPLIFFEMSSCSSFILLFKSTFTKSKGFVCVNCFAGSSPIIIVLSQLP